MGSVGNVESLKSLESEVSGSLGDKRQALDNFSDSVNASLEVVSGVEESALRVLLSLGDLVVALVLLDESENSSCGLL